MNERRLSPASDWPVDPDVAADDVSAHRPAHAIVDVRRVAVVLAGGFVGGLVRYETAVHWTSAAGTFPWSTFVVNTAGALILGALIIVVLDVIGPSVYSRPLIGAGFCGALTTFSAVAVQVDELSAHGHFGLGCGYVLASVIAGLAAAALGATLARRIPPTQARRAISATGH